MKRIIFYIVYIVIMASVWWLLQMTNIFLIKDIVNTTEGLFFVIIITSQVFYSWINVKSNLLGKIILYPILFLIATQLIFTLVSFVFYGISYIIGWTAHFDLLNKNIRDPLSIFLFVLILIYGGSTTFIWELYWKKKDMLDKMILNFKQRL